MQKTTNNEGKQAVFCQFSALKKMFWVFTVENKFIRNVTPANNEGNLFDIFNTTVLCVKDCGLHNQNINPVISFACLVVYLDYSPVEIKKIKVQFLKTAWAYAWDGKNIAIAIDYFCFTRLPGGRGYLLVVLVIEDEKQCSLPMDTFHGILLI